jgi:phage major head subunit gpT-like protein
MDISGALGPLYIKYNQLMQQTILNIGINWPKFAQMLESSTTTEQHVFADRIPIARQWLAARVVNNLSLRTWTATNLVFEDTLALDAFNVADNKINAFAPAVQMLSMQAAKWADNLFFNKTYGAIAGGTSFVTYDGVDFWSASHPVNVDAGATGPLGTQSNYSTSFALTSANFFTARQTMRAYNGADGLPLNVNPDTLMIGTALEASAIQILQTQWTAPSVALGQNAAGVVQQNALYGTADLLTVPDMQALNGVIATGNPWLLMDTQGPLKPFIYQLREAPQFYFLLSPQSAPMIDRHELQMGFHTRGVGTYGPYFQAYLGVG